jgi:Fe-S cluster biogenesis protein NfuA
MPPAKAYSARVSSEPVERLSRLMAEVERFDEPVAATVLELLGTLDALHRAAMHRLGEVLGSDGLARVRAADPAIAWLFDVYDVGVDERAAAAAALQSVRPYVESHGGRVEVLGARAGVVRVRLAGACAGCTASAITLRHGVEEALAAHLPGFVALEVEEDAAPAHPPPGPTLLEIENRLT